MGLFSGRFGLEQAADGRGVPDRGLAPVSLGDQEDVQVRPERPADIGEQKIGRVARARLEAPALRGRRHSDSHNVPITSVMTVSGAPMRK